MKAFNLRQIKTGDSDITDRYYDPKPSPEYAAKIEEAILKWGLIKQQLGFPLAGGVLRDLIEEKYAEERWTFNEAVDIVLENISNLDKKKEVDMGV